MPRADATRITWFLGLQRIVRFPRFSIAPTRASGYRRQPPDQTSEGAASDEAVLQHGVAAAPKFPYPVRGAVADSKRVVGLIGAPKATAGFSRVTAKIAVDQPSLKALVQAPMTPASVLALPETFRHIGAKRFVGAGILLPRDESLPMTRFMRASSGLSKSKALAPSPHASSTQLLSDRKVDPAKRFAMRGTDNSLRRQDLMFGGDHSVPGSRAVDDQGEFSQQRDAPDATEGQRGKPAVSTLHIDGSALGRWTVQHLERALNKPTTGMTGIDPRAAAPRSRVAPF